MFLNQQSIENTLTLCKKVKLKQFNHDFFHELNQDNWLQFERTLDEKLGLCFQLIEKGLQESAYEYSESYISEALECQALNTSYLDFIQIFSYLNLTEKDHFIDIGAGYGRSALLINLLYPQAQVTAIEHVKERVEVAKNVGRSLQLPTSSFHCQDILDKDYSLPLGNYYFLYLPLGKLLHKVLYDLKAKALQNHFTLVVIESHGELVNRLKKESWLDEVQTNLTTIAPRHDDKIYLFKSNSKELANGQSKLQSLEDKFFSSKSSFQIEIKDKDLNNDQQYIWSASSQNMIFNLIDSDKVCIDLSTPPRTINIEQIQSFESKKVPPFYKEREENNEIILRLKNEDSAKKAGWIRKIIIHPKMIIEFSELGRIPYNQIINWEVV